MVTILERVFQLVARKSSDTLKRVGKLVLLLPASLFAQTQSDYYRIETYELPKGVNFEASGLAVRSRTSSALPVACMRSWAWPGVTGRCMPRSAWK
jgi:hypothetical protein